MKTKLLVLTAASAATLIAGAALAQDAPRGARGDADGDGRVSRAEFVDARIARLTAVDANRDGSVSAEEMRSGVDTRRNQRASGAFERLDANGDGSLSRDEFMARPMSRAEGGRRGGRAGQRGPVSIDQARTRSTEAFARMDANNDGYLTQDERRAGHGMRGRHGRRGAPGEWGPSAPASE